ncbi:hypothetical protein KIH74_06895 [Kineosporia sp. J2-2]|uniref:NYN domain-containing protein n=1 Tax=Kineosporia corallincola TaxID=2835133 RepID=A0ABS5TC40_9ACTN|nr:hypothetical protein [Kineosporia corallincola]MBT0768647.1 hypothetical protein [Kineosporia corallincola]
MAGVLLIDLENMVGHGAGVKVLAPRLDALLRQAGPGLSVVAACRRTRMGPGSQEILQERGVRLLLVDDGKGAADQVLLHEARRQAGQGCRRFLVASADRAFAAVADLGRLEILLWEGQQPLAPNRYTRVADMVHRIPRPARGFPAHERSPAAGTDAPQVSAHDQQDGFNEPQEQGVAVGRPEAMPVPAASAGGRSEWAGLLLFAGTVFAAGVLFGAGTAVGESVAGRLLRSGRC